MPYRIIRAPQYLYGNPNTDESPSGRGGFQDLCYTLAALSAEEIAELRGRVVYYYFPTGEQVPKLFFCPLGKARYAVGRVLPVDGLDDYGRLGKSLAHCLVFAEDDFRFLKCNPFAVFQLFEPHFAADYAAVAELPGRDKGDVPEVTLTVSDEEVESCEVALQTNVDQWAAAELQKLAHLALRAANLEAEQASLALAGTQEQMKAVLQMALFLVPPDERVRCSFDTHAYKTNPLASQWWWIRGYPTRQDAPSRLPVIQADTRTVQSDPAVPESLYEIWLFTRLGRKDWQQIGVGKPAAQELQRLLLGQPRTAGNVQMMSQEWLDDFCVDHRDMILARLEAALSQAMGAGPTVKAVGLVAARCQEAGGGELLKVLARGVPLEGVADEVLWILRSEEIPRQQMAAMEANVARHPVGRVGAYLAFRRREDDLLRGRMANLPENEYRWLVDFMLAENPSVLRRILTPARALCAIEQYVGAASKSPELLKELQDTVRELAKLRHLAALDALTPLVAHCSPGQVRELLKMLESLGTQVPWRLAEATLARMAELPPERSGLDRLLGRIRGPFRR